jgi:hypothetical protein
MRYKELLCRPAFSLFLIVFTAMVATAQTSEFTFQGSLKDGANAANGNYDFEFALYDSLTVGSQLGATLSRNAVAVSNGAFAVKLDFGGQFPGANRFLEIRVRLTGQPGITTLSPRQQISNAPYSVRSLNAANADNASNAANAVNAATSTNALQLGGVAANQYVLTTDARMTDARAPTAGSTSYIQNTASPQTASNFNISGNGTAGGTLGANIVNATTQYNIGGSRVLSVAGTSNAFVGVGAGAANTGFTNSFLEHWPVKAIRQPPETRSSAHLPVRATLRAITLFLVWQQVGITRVAAAMLSSAPRPVMQTRPVLPTLFLERSPARAIRRAAGTPFSELRLDWATQRPPTTLSSVLRPVKTIPPISMPSSVLRPAW